jgi:hypothetical protein
MAWLAKTCKVKYRSLLYCIVFIVRWRDPNIMDIEHITVIEYQGKIHKLHRVWYNQCNIIKFIYLNIHPEYKMN